MILLAAALSPLLLNFLYAILIIAMIGCLIWAINTYIHPIPPPILAILAIVLVIVAVLYFLGGR
jgi:hypothetical protein